MSNLKGRRIASVTIIKGHVMAYDEKGVMFKLTRAQRDILSKYNSADFLDDIIKAFGNENILSPYFSIKKDGEVVYE